MRRNDYLPEKHKTKLFSVRLPEEIRKELERTARKKTRKMAEIVVAALTMYFEAIK